MGRKKKDRKEICWEIVDKIGVTQERDKWLGFVNTVMNLWVP
jgi:hypothetical protein